MKRNRQKIIEDLQQNDLRNYFQPVKTETDQGTFKRGIDLLKPQLSSNNGKKSNDRKSNGQKINDENEL